MPAIRSASTLRWSTRVGSISTEKARSGATSKARRRWPARSAICTGERIVGVPPPQCSVVTRGLPGIAAATWSISVFRVSR